MSQILLTESDLRARAYRKQHFKVSVETLSDEASERHGDTVRISYTFNGFQSTCLTLSPDEALRFAEAIVSHHNYGVRQTRGMKS